MFEKIVYISDNSASIKVREDAALTMNLMNLHLVFEDDKKTILGEVDDIDGSIVKARFLGEIIDNKLVGGVIRKPALSATIRTVKKEEIPMIVGEDKKGNMLLGASPFYNNFPVYLDVNNFFSNHFAIFGNSGSGKSCGVSRIIQNMFLDERLFPYKSNILLFDSSGEYYNAFKDLNQINPNYNYRFITTNETAGSGEKLRLPVYLLNKEDLALLLECNQHSQLPIIERMLKLARIFAEKGANADAYKNHLIAKAIMTILYTNQTSPNKRNDVFSILATCSTPEFNLEAPVEGIGYTRKFRECFIIDSKGGFSESVLLTEYLTKFIKEEFENIEPSGESFYGLTELEKALNFTLISEGWLRNENTYGDAVTVRVRLHSLITGVCAKFFEVDEEVSIEKYLSSLLISNNKKYQLVNINLDDVDDTFAKVITKIYSRLIFEFAKCLPDRGSIPFHIIVEEAHRYIQNDTDRYLIGYNIFERIAKEGRKYGVILGLITQRPSELSDTTISQCSSFLIFKMNHPADVEYIKKMVPNISDEIIEKQKSLQSGTCLTFGRAFKIPLIVRLAMPNPEPRSGNCDVVKIWDGNPNGSNSDNKKLDEANGTVINFNYEEEKNESISEMTNKPLEQEITLDETPQSEINTLSSMEAVNDNQVPIEANVQPEINVQSPAEAVVNNQVPINASVQPEINVQSPAEAVVNNQVPINASVQPEINVQSPIGPIDNSQVPVNNVTGVAPTIQPAITPVDITPVPQN